uniref:kelch-like protein 12 n=1 Tax=Styela clava TaxID=7725 RepID=UPI00193AD24F|nr:kelch-like protein 12 [Styela clava]
MNVTSAGSDYFDAMLSHDNLESNTGIVDMKEVDVANIMQLSRYCEMVEEFLQANLGPKSFFLIRVAIKFNLKGLGKACDEYAVGHIGSIAIEAAFNKLDKDYMMFLITCKWSLYSENSKLKVLLQWIKADTGSRAKYFIEMVQKLQIDKISISYGCRLVRNHSFCSKSAEFMKLLYLANESNVKDEKVTVPLFSPLSDDSLLLFDKKSESVQVYCPVEETFDKLKQLNENMLIDTYITVYLNKFVFVLFPYRKVYRVNLGEADSNWTEMESMMNDHGQYIRATVHNNFIYVCGNNTMERYNNNENKWENVESSSIKPNGRVLVPFQDEIYVIGGDYRGEKVDKYSPSVGSWSSVKPMNVAKGIPAAAVYDDRIYIAGGWNKSVLSSAEFFNPDDNTWTNVTSMTVPKFKGLISVFVLSTTTCLLLEIYLDLILLKSTILIKINGRK